MCNQLIAELWAQSTERCPYIRYDGSTCFCCAVNSSEVCDTASLQLWCLDGERYHKCLFYPKEIDHGDLFHAVGVLRYSIPKIGHKLVAEIDRDIGDYYFRLIPLYKNVNRQMYAPHISVVRHETPVNLEHWGKYEGQEIEFTYSNRIHHGKVYYWLNAFSKRLEEIRLELGLPVSSQYTRPPDGFVKCFHITLANIKEIG